MFERSPCEDQFGHGHGPSNTSWKGIGVNLRVMTHDNSMIIRFSELVGLRSCDKSGQITVLPKPALSGFGEIPDSLNHHFCWLTAVATKNCRD